MKMTLELANAAARDAAERNMRENGRLIWNEEDYNVAVSVAEKLWWSKIITEEVSW